MVTLAEYVGSDKERELRKLTGKLLEKQHRLLKVQPKEVSNDDKSVS